MSDSKPLSTPSWFYGTTQESTSTPATTTVPTRRRVARHGYDDHPLIVAVRQYNADLARNGETPLAPRSLDEYIGVLASGVAAGDLCTPLTGSRTASRFHAVRAALRFAARAIEAKRPVLAAHGIADQTAFYGLDVDRLVERTDRHGPKAVRPAKITITDREWYGFVQAVRQHLRPPLRDVCLIILQGDLRANDVLRVSRPVAEDVVARGQAVTVQKGGRLRAWVAEPEVRHALGRLLSNPSWDTLRDLVVRPDELPGDFDDVRLTRVAYGRVYRALDDVATQAALPGFHGTHAFRRALAAKLVRQKAPDRVIQSALGHANIATTQIYTGGASSDEVEEYRARVRQDVFSRPEKR